MCHKAFGEKSAHFPPPPTKVFIFVIFCFSLLNPYYV